MLLPSFLLYDFFALHRSTVLPLLGLLATEELGWAVEDAPVLPCLVWAAVGYDIPYCFSVARLNAVLFFVYTLYEVVGYVLRR
jgi:hypothetical protein